MENIQEILEEEESLQYLKKRPKTPELKTRYDYVKVIASIVKRPIPQMLKLTAHFPDEWFIQIASECKLKKTEVDKAKYIWWFLKESRTK